MRQPFSRNGINLPQSLYRAGVLLQLLVTELIDVAAMQTVEKRQEKKQEKKRQGFKP